MNDFLEPRELIRNLRRGTPIEIDGDTVRLPRFSDIREASTADLGAGCDHDIIVAHARTATWCLWPLDRRAKVESVDGEVFLDVIERLQRTQPEKPVKGWILTTAPVDDGIRGRFADEGHRISRIS